MRKQMEKLGNSIKGMYFTENPVNYDGRHEGCKYFMCFCSTNKICGSWKTQAEAIEGMKDIIEYYNELDSKCE